MRQITLNFYSSVKKMYEKFLPIKQYRKFTPMTTSTNACCRKSMHSITHLLTQLLIYKNTHIHSHTHTYMYMHIRHRDWLNDCLIAICYFCGMFCGTTNYVLYEFVVAAARAY